MNGTRFRDGGKWKQGPLEIYGETRDQAGSEIQRCDAELSYGCQIGAGRLPLDQQFIAQIDAMLGIGRECGCRIRARWLWFVRELSGEIRRRGDERGGSKTRVEQQGV